MTPPTTMSFEHEIKILSLDTLRFKLDVEKINISIISFEVIDVNRSFSITLHRHFFMLVNYEKNPYIFFIHLNPNF